MMDRDTVQSEENQAGLRRRELHVACVLLRDAIELRDCALQVYADSAALSDELGQFCDDLSNAIGRLEKAIEGDR